VNRGVAGVLFVLGSLVGGPLVFLAASLVVVNGVRAALLFLQASFDFSDFSYLPWVAVTALAVAVIYGINQGLMFLAVRTVGVKGRELFDAQHPTRATAGTIDLSEPYERSRRWLLVLFTVFVVAFLFSVVVGLWFGRTSDEELMRFISAGLGNEFVFVALALGVYMPFAVATFAMARTAMELEVTVVRVEGPLGRPAFLTVAWLLPPVVLVAWLILQGVTGGLF
jgi:hypothetical protein